METKSSVEKILNPSSKTLYLFFGGIQAGIVIPPFEFYKASEIISENKVFFRDFSQSWYHAGLKGLSVDIHTTAKYIQALIDDIKPEKLFFVGNSMGGYAALLFSTILGVGEAIAFAPQTFISADLRKRYNDVRWQLQIEETLALPTIYKDALDLKKMLLNSNSENKKSIYVARDSELDFAHAQHVRSCPGVTVFEFEKGGHSLVRGLRESGALPEIMTGEYTKIHI